MVDLPPKPEICRAVAMMFVYDDTTVDGSAGLRKDIKSHSYVNQSQLCKALQSIMLILLVRHSNARLEPDSTCRENAKTATSDTINTLITLKTKYPCTLVPSYLSSSNLMTKQSSAERCSWFLLA